jgi:hypothetical protein
MKYIVTTLALLLVNCQNMNIKGYYVAPEIVPYVDSFIYNAKTYNVTIVIDNILIDFTNKLEPDEMGECLSAIGLNPIIRINRSAWLKMSDSSKEQLIYHELGHCILNRDHLNTFGVNGNPYVPVSIMYEYMIYDDIYDYNVVHYYQELFNPK